jgi:8-oxo-dGTP pyrophosphatase MutT (NUDIX family)
MQDPQPIRNAATVILARDGREGPEILMGQRGAGAVFMPNKFVFPGGAVDPDDARVPLARGLGDTCARRLAEAPLPDAPAPQAIAATAIRELWEETGLALARPGNWPCAADRDWQALATAGLCPDAAPLHFVFRAITPPGRTRRFDARFFLAEASAIAGDPDDFTHAQDELAHLQWIPLRRARSFDLPFITEVVLAEVSEMIRKGFAAPDSVPFFDNSGQIPQFRRIA